MSDLKQHKCLLVKEHKKSDHSILLEIELNNSKKLNVLNMEIILALNQTIKKWKNREDLSAVFIHASGDRAFCAGGDVVSVYLKILEERKKGRDPALAGRDFFKTEYETDYMLHHFPKPVVLWGSGIVMGGGMGLFMASSYPIVTETSMLAMPEISIGFFPDVGASYFLNQIPKDFGRYLALTACRLNAKEACFLNLTKWVCLQKDKQKIFDFLLNINFKNKPDFHNKFNDFYKKPQFLDEQSCWIKDFQKEISESLVFKNLKAFYDYLSQTKMDDKKWEQNRNNFLKASPTSLAVIFEQLKKAKGEEDLQTLLEQEAVMAMRFSQSADFPEGVKSLLIEKNNQAKWNPSCIEDLDLEEIEKYFTPETSWDCTLNI